MASEESLNIFFRVYFEAAANTRFHLKRQDSGIETNPGDHPPKKAVIFRHGLQRFHGISGEQAKIRCVWRDFLVTNPIDDIIE